MIFAPLPCKKVREDAPEDPNVNEELLTKDNETDKEDLEILYLLRILKQLSFPQGSYYTH